MKKSKYQTKQSGFTIIEVMIVLAVAAVILLIVLLAVPAFQRNQRNTARKQDVGRLATAVTNFIANNSGTMPSVAADATTMITDAGTLGGYSGLAGASPVGTAANTKLSIVAAGAGTPAALATTLIDSVQVVTGGICSGSGATNVGAVAKNFAIQYTLETGTAGTSAAYCQNGG